MNKVIDVWMNGGFWGRLTAAGETGAASGRAARLNPQIVARAKMCLKGLALLTLLAVLSGLALDAWGRREALIPAEVAVVLGNEVYRDGSPAPRLAARLDKSVDLYRYGYCRTIIVSGGVGLSGVDEAKAMSAYLQSRGVPEWDIVVDSQGVNTWQTALFTAAYLEQHHLDSAIVVSQAFHTPRSAMALKKAGCENVGRAAPAYREWGDVYSIARELAAIVVYFFKY
ncbi:MAG: YdcF family protein [Candidatus Adiutrix sp.]|jgi:vancomycin permeability regulator SanA|nr:YdcF family protein [Candidatus Adiutrix sp.]